MGRRGYMNMIALGRSPYEAPEPPPEGHVHTQNPATSTNAEGYVQQYDDRGHPTNPASKALAKQLRRAKNDILSTMGIVVSGEEGTSGTATESKKAELLGNENNYGIIVATLDQIVMFTSSWWTSALTSRIQTFKRYDQTSLTQTMRFERRQMGLFAFYYSGMPSWICSFLVAICRTHLLDLPLDYAHAKLSSLFESKHFKSTLRVILMVIKLSIKCVTPVILGQAYMFSFLQMLDLVPTFAAPSLKSFLPFGEHSLLQLPALHTLTSARGIGEFATSLFFSPFPLVCCIVSLRPVLETRIYRLIRRRLPKPDRPDRLSVRVALEGDLIEWTVPNLGKRSREEIIRGQLSITEDILFEIATLRRWVTGLFRWRKWAKKIFLEHIRGIPKEERPESFHRRVEQLRRDIEAELAAETSSSPLPRPPARAPPLREVGNPRLPSPLLEDGELAQILTGEDQRFAQSPLQLREDYFPDIPNTDHIFLNDGSGGATIGTHQPHTRGPEVPPRLHSRANTLFSQPSSPDLSPLTSPRVRASLVHQNSDVITMQLELLQSSNARNSNTQNQGNVNGSGGGANVSSEAQQNNEPQNSAIDRASELLDAILANHTHNRPTVAPRFHEELDTSMPSTIIPTAGPEVIQPTPAVIAAQPSTLTTAEFQTTEHPLATEQLQETEDEGAPHPRRSRTRRRTRTNTGRATVPDHRVTILSTHAVDSLSSHVAVLLTSMLLYPLESLALRSLAVSYLSSSASLGILTRGSPSSITNLGLHPRTAVYGVRSLGCWFGGGSMSNRLSYIGKLLLVTGLEAITSLALWGVGTSVAVVIGRRKFGWGEL